MSNKLTVGYLIQRHRILMGLEKTVVAEIELAIEKHWEAQLEFLDLVDLHIYNAMKAIETLEVEVE